jgi:hypothetical protein
MPAWLCSVAAIYVLSAIRAPLQNLTYLVVLLATYGVFRRYVRADVGRFCAVCGLFAVVLSVSAAFLMFGYLDIRRSLAIRAWLFGGSVYEFLIPPTGLALWIHLYGYQAAALGGISAAWVYRGGRQTCSRAAWDALVISMAGLVLMLSWQRSAVLSTGAALVVVVARRGFRRLVLPLALVGVAVAGGRAVAPDLGILQHSVIQKNEADALKYWRLELQHETLGIIAQHPWGLDLENASWGPELFKWGGALSQRDVTGHNAYLMKIVYLGLPIAIVVIYMIATTVAMAWRHLGGVDRGGGEFWAGAMALALIATMFNALLHNASIYTAEGSSIFAYVALWHWDDMRRGAAEDDWFNFPLTRGGA